MVGVITHDLEFATIVDDLGATLNNVVNPLQKKMFTIQKFMLDIHSDVFSTVK